MSIWETCGKPKNAAAADPITDAYLRSPIDRVWLTACVEWLRDEKRDLFQLPGNDFLQAYFPNIQVREAATAFLEVARIIHTGASPESALPEVANARRLPLGQVYDIHRELTALRLDATLLSSVEPSTIQSKLSVSGPILFTAASGDIAAMLTVDFVPRPKGSAARLNIAHQIWRAPALLLLGTDVRWNEAEKLAIQFLADSNLLPSDYDFRYQVTLPPGVEWERCLAGDSWCGQLQLLLLRAVGKIDRDAVHHQFPQLRRIDFKGVAVTACGLDQQGNHEGNRFYPVACFFRKFVTGIRKSKEFSRSPTLASSSLKFVAPSSLRSEPGHCVNTFVVALGQSFDTLTYPKDKPNVNIWREPITRVPIVKATDLREALMLLDLLQRPQRIIRNLLAVFVFGLALAVLAYNLRPTATPDFKLLANIIQTEEAKTPGTGGIERALASWNSQYRLSRLAGLKKIRTWANQVASSAWNVNSATANITDSSASQLSTKLKTQRELECALFLRDKMKQIDSEDFSPTNEWTVESNQLSLVRIPAGSLHMGSSLADTNAAKNEIPPIKVDIPRQFWMGKYEVTQGEYRAITEQRRAPGFYYGRRWIERLRQTIDYGKLLSRPVETITYKEAMAFCRRLTELERDRIDHELGEDYEFRLPTEAEWEYACRAGTDDIYSFGDSPEELPTYAWVNVAATKPVGLKFPNIAGLYDMHGNVNEMCIDREGDKYVARGGSAIDQDPARFRCAYRFGWVHTQPGNTFGFRVVLAPRLAGDPAPLRSLKK
ncbi:MAG: SUMF1/EgtB/PvdO family nonheme iron enzyme [Verrucomicrobiales bacterium]|nr:SUMF1/EgtB/PvdO family nonheme iron enzyme [Verrucomicrobiales bacterium]